MAVTSTGATRGRDAARRGAGRRGFTLTELLVVIGIAVILLAISVPIGRSLREGNRLLACKSQMQQIGQAVKMYYLDEKGAPPLYIGTNQDPTADAPTGPGLLALYDTAYLSRRMTLHCPRDVYTMSEDPEFLYSYQRKWDDVGAEYALNRYSYLPFRGITDSGDVNYRRQLQPGEVPSGGTVAVPVPDMNWVPADDTVITWCGFHKDSVSMGGEGQYLVLFWDGSVIKVAESIMEDPTAGEEAWKVSFDDASG